MTFPVSPDHIASRPTASRPTASRPTASRPTASRPTASRPRASRPTASRPTEASIASASIASASIASASIASASIASASIASASIASASTASASTASASTASASTASASTASASTASASTASASTASASTASASTASASTASASTASASIASASIASASIASASIASASIASASIASASIASASIASASIASASIASASIASASIASASIASASIASASIASASIASASIASASIASAFIASASIGSTAHCKGLSPNPTELQPFTLQQAILDRSAVVWRSHLAQGLVNHLRIIAGELILLCYALGFLLILLGEKFRDLFKWRRKKPRPKSRSGEESAVKSNRREMLCVPPQCLADPSLGRHTYIKIGNNKYHYVESGSMGSPRVVLCLHDFADFWYGFRHQLRGLSPIAWVIALDLKGSSLVSSFGDSDKPPEMKEYAMEAIVSELKTFIQMLEHDRVVLVGHGIGGLIGWHLVDQCPHLIEKFVCLATPHPKTFRDKMSKNWRSMKKHRNWFLYRLPGFPDRELAKSGLDIFTSRMGRKTYTSLVTFSNMDLEAYKYSFSRESDWTGPLNYIRNFPSHRYIPLGMSGKMLQTPTLFIIGSIDTEPNQLKSTNWGTLDYITATNVAAEFCNYTKDLGATKHYVCPPNLNFHTLPGNLSFMGQGMWWCRQTELRSKTVYHEDFNNLFAIHFNDIPDKAQDDNDYLFGEKDVDYIMKLSCPKISQLFDPKRPELSN
eukprot:maker-scaffold692_size110616-snap-gene-0.17 protein:Tk12302 transcript:maker-scaffold692_size110616-snap-gene-0.17-mRNA-1 annotation:"abhydrolase domain-containing protein 7"